MKKNFMKKIFLMFFITTFYALSSITTTFGASNTSTSTGYRIQNIINQVDSSKVSTVYNAKRNIEGKKGVPQGFCIAKGYFVYVIYNKNNNHSYLRFVSIKERKQKQQIYLGKYGHINDITYNPSTKKVIVPVDNEKTYLVVDVSSSNPKNFKKIDKLTIYNGVRSYGIAYCSKYNNYIISNNNNIYYTHKGSLTKTLSTNPHKLGNKKTMRELGRQGIACHGNRWYYTKWVEKDMKDNYGNSIFYAYRNSNFIVEYDFDYKVKQNIFIPKSTFTGEIEGVDFYNNQMYGLFIQGENLVILKIDYSTGFKKDSKGNKYYYYKRTQAGHFMGQKATGWNKIDGKTYYMKKSGVVATGWNTINGKTYYMKKDGAIATGWNTINGFKYYFGDNGVMRTGFQTIGGKYYYFYESKNEAKKQYKGTLASKGWLNINKRKFYIGSNGEVYTGNREVNGKRYEFSKENKNGLLKGEMYLIEVK